MSYCPKCGGNMGTKERCWRCEPQTEPKPTSATKPRRSGRPLVLAAWVIGVFLLVGVVCYVGFARTGASPTATSRIAVTVEMDLGVLQGPLGSTGQASQVLSMINSQPNHASYSLSYVAAGYAVVFGCDFQKEIIIRVNQRADGTGTTEVWKGYVTERLQSAASGGSLNQTPAGNIPGSYELF